MSNILVVIGSARKGRVADKVLTYITEDLSKRDTLSVTVADLKEVDLPFFDSETVPSQPGYAPTDERAIAWQKLVADSNGVVFITPEYNHTLSAIQKNAIDHLYGEWENKPIVAVGYGWVGGARAITTLEAVMKNVNADWKPEVANLAFMKDLNPDGSLLDEESVRQQIAAAIDQLA